MRCNRRHAALGDLFDEIDSKADGQLDEEEFLAFFEAAEMTIRDHEMQPEVAASEAPAAAPAEAPAAEEDAKDAAASEDAAGAAAAGGDAAMAAEKVQEPLDEKAASIAIRRAIQKLRIATPDTFDKLHADLEEVVKQQLENTGLLKESIQAEIKKGVDLARKRVERLGTRSEAKAKKAAAAEEPPGPLEPREEKLQLPTAGAKRLFKHLSAASNGFISREVFIQLARIFMRVVKEVPLTPGSGVCKSSDVLRKLEAKEVVEVLHGPMREPATGSVRVEARTFKDARQGWVTVVDGKATFIKEGSQLFKVVKETILTVAFELELTQVHTLNLQEQSKRKLKVGEILEALTWPAGSFPSPDIFSSNILTMLSKLQGPLISPSRPSSSDSFMRTPTLSKAPRRSFLSMVPSLLTSMSLKHSLYMSFCSSEKPPSFCPFPMFKCFS